MATKRGNLTDRTVSSAKPAERQKKLFDGNGLHVVISTSGGKSWRLKFEFGGSEKTLTLGQYPAVSLQAARTLADEARALLAQGIDPAARKAARKAAAAADGDGSFEVVAREWIKQQSTRWSKATTQQITSRLERDVFPRLGRRPVAEIDPPEVLAVIRRIEARGAAESAHRTLRHVSGAMRYAVATGRRGSDPCRDLLGALAPVRGGHFAAVVDPAGVGELLRTLAAYKGSPVVRAALLLGPQVFVRPGELRTARWADIDLDGAQWAYTTPKTGKQHVVPLSRQAVEILRDIQPLTGRGEFVFPSARSAKRPMSDGAVLGALRRLEVGKDTMTGHGWRATARTLLDEVLNFPPHLIEHQLAHEVKDALGRSYNRTTHLPERRRMMQAWSDYLDSLREGRAKVVALRPGA